MTVEEVLPLQSENVLIQNHAISEVEVKTFIKSLEENLKDFCFFC